MLGTSYELKSFIKKYSIQEIIIAISRVRKGVMFDLIDRCKKACTVVHVVSDLYAEVNERMEAEEYGGLRTYRIAPFEEGIVRRFTWRLFNLIGSGLLLMILSPVFLAIAIAVKRDSDGPVFYMSDIENRNTLFDIEILLRTIPVVLFGKGSRIEKAKEKSLEEKIEELRN